MIIRIPFANTNVEIKLPHLLIGISAILLPKMFFRARQEDLAASGVASLNTDNINNQAQLANHLQSIAHHYQYTTAISSTITRANREMLLSIVGADDAKLSAAIIAISDEKLEQSSSLWQHALRMAAAQENVVAMKCILNRNVDINHKDASGRSALYEAVKAGQIVAAKLLIASGANVNLAEASGRTPLAMAVLSDNSEMVNLLLESGAEVNKSDIWGHAPLMLAAAKDNLGAMRSILGANANIDQQTGNGETALYEAASKGKIAAVSELIAKGANINLATLRGDTPLAAAARRGHNEIFNLLLTAGAHFERNNSLWHPILAFSALRDDIVTMRWILDHTIDDLDYTDPQDLFPQNRKTVLHEAAQAGTSAAVNLLIARGANVNLAAATGMTPLALAAAAGNSEIAESLLAHGALLHMPKVRYVNTPIMAAAINGHIELVRLLLDFAHSNKLKLADIIDSNQLARYDLTQPIVEMLEQTLSDSSVAAYDNYKLRPIR